MIAKTTRVIFSVVFFSFHHQNPGESLTSTVPKKKRKRIWNVLPKNKKTFTHIFYLFMKTNISKQNVYTYIRQEEREPGNYSAVHCRGQGIWYNLARLQQLQFLISWGNLCCSCLIKSIVWHDFVQNIASTVLITSIRLNAFFWTAYINLWPKYFCRFWAPQ